MTFRFAFIHSALSEHIFFFHAIHLGIQFVLADGSKEYAKLSKTGCRLDNANPRWSVGKVDMEIITHFLVASDEVIKLLTDTVNAVIRN